MTQLLCPFFRSKPTAYGGKDHRGGPKFRSDLKVWHTRNHQRAFDPRESNQLGKTSSKANLQGGSSGESACVLGTRHRIQNRNEGRAGGLHETGLARGANWRPTRRSGSLDSLNQTGARGHANRNGKNRGNARLRDDEPARAPVGARPIERSSSTNCRQVLPARHPASDRGDAANCALADHRNAKRRPDSY